MRPTHTRGTNKTFVKPKGWNDELDGDCGDLEVRIQPFGKRLIEFVSTWKPSAEEIAHIVRGGVIELFIVGSQPPVGLLVVDPVSPPGTDARPVRHDYNQRGSTWALMSSARRTRSPRTIARPGLCDRGSCDLALMVDLRRAAALAARLYARAGAGVLRAHASAATPRASGRPPDARTFLQHVDGDRSPERLVL
jgi:hypothetical protein